MKNIFIVYFALILSAIIAFSACGEDVNNSLPDASDGDYIGSSSDIDSGDISVQSGGEQSEESIESEASEETDSKKTIQISTDTGRYVFDLNACTGSYSTDFRADETEDGVIELTLLDGRVIYLNYNEIVYNEADETHRTVINGFDFVINEFHDENNNFCQRFECVEPAEGFVSNGRDSITVVYYPELEYGNTVIAFDFEIKDGKYILHYADGRDITKSISFDESTDTYYFE